MLVCFLKPIESQSVGEAEQSLVQGSGTNTSFLLPERDIAPNMGRLGFGRW